MVLVRISREEKRKIRKKRIRKRISGTTLVPRVAVKKSLRHIYVQVIDDTRGVTLCAKSSLSPDIVEFGKLPKTQVAGLVGKKLGEEMMERGILQAVFDRGGHKYHG
ncbi:MAG: 50S ribosomal protein L18, partial [bacterium]